MSAHSQNHTNSSTCIYSHFFCLFLLWKKRLRPCTYALDPCPSELLKALLQKISPLSSLSLGFFSSLLDCSYQYTSVKKCKRSEILPYLKTTGILPQFQGWSRHYEKIPGSEKKDFSADSNRRSQRISISLC